MAFRIYNEVKIDSKGRILLPKELREYLKSKGVQKVWFEQDTEKHTHFLKWKNPETPVNPNAKKSHITRANERFGKYSTPTDAEIEEALLN